MEGFELIASGAWSIVPPILALVLALVTKEVYSSLTLGVFSGLIIYSFLLNGVSFGSFIQAFALIPQMLSAQIGSNGALILFLALLGALTVVIAVAGGSRAYAAWVTKHIKNARVAGILTALLGIFIFIDDYFNCLTVGAVMRPILDRFHVSREKLAWIIDSMAAPVCIIAPVSSWAVAVGGYLGDGGFNTFVASIPYNLYALLTIFFVFLVLATGWDFGPMRRADLRAAGKLAPAKGKRTGAARRIAELGLDTNGTMPPDEAVVTERADFHDGTLDDPETYKGIPISRNGRVADLVVPILTLIVFSVLGMLYVGGFFDGGVSFSEAIGEDPITGLCIGTCVALVVALCMYLPRRLTTLGGFVEGVSEGVRSMVGAIMILVLAWSLGACCRYLLGTGEFVSTFLTTVGFPLPLLPVVVAAIAAFIGFATGTSWGTMALILPIVLGVFAPGDPLYLVTIGATLAGSVFGDHISPISDTTILSSTGAQCNHLDHVSTQIPYASMVMGVSLVGYVISGLTANPWIALAFGLVAVTLCTWLLHRASVRRCGAQQG